jgi:cardiolipin synthase
MTIPTFITIGRILLVPVTIWLIISGAYGLAFLCFVIAGVSDAIDGYLARALDQRSELGAYLDPLADKALLVSVYVTLGFLREIPAWLVIAVVTRDVLIVAAIMLSWFIDRPIKEAP